MPSAQIATQTREQVTLDSASGQVRRYTHRAFDSGDGYIVDNSGTVDYGNGQFALPVLPVVSESVWNSATDNWGSQAGGAEKHSFDSGAVTVYYSPAGSGSLGEIDILVPTPDVMLQLLPASLDERMVPGSLLFTMGGHSYSDRAGVLYRDIDPQTGAGLAAGSVDYLTGRAFVSGVSGDTSDLDIKSLLTRFGDWATTQASFRTAMAPLKPEALSISAMTEDGQQLYASADEHGMISDDWIEGSANYKVGTAKVRFGQDDGSGNWIDKRIDPTSIRYNAVAYKYLPMDATILGIDPVRLPADGRVPIYRPGDLVLIMHSEQEAPVTLSSGQSIQASRGRISWFALRQADGKIVSTDNYLVDRLAGKITLISDEDLAQPLTLRHTIADLRVVSDAQITGELTLSRPLSHDFPAQETLIGSCLVLGDRRARVGTVFDQVSWNNVWKDTQQGDAAPANLNTIDYPIQVSNFGTDTDRWALRFTTATTGQVVSERRGVLGTFDTSQDLAIINPRTRNQDGSGGAPYFFIAKQAWGTGWSAGNVIFFPTFGAIADFWAARSIQQSNEPFDDGADGCEIYSLGNIDRP